MIDSALLKLNYLGPARLFINLPRYVGFNKFNTGMWKKSLIYCKLIVKMSTVFDSLFENKLTKKTAIRLRCVHTFLLAVMYIFLLQQTNSGKSHEFVVSVKNDIERRELLTASLALSGCLFYAYQPRFGLRPHNLWFTSR